MMRKILSVICSVALLFALSGCLDGLSDGSAGASGTGAAGYDYERFNKQLNGLIDEHQAVGEGEYAAARLIVSARSESALRGLGAKACIEAPGGAFILQFATPAEAEQAAAKLSATAGVAYAEPDRLVSCEEFSSWGAWAMGVDLFASTYYTRQVMTPVIAVVDSGVNSHEMIDYTLAGWDFVEGDSTPNDQKGHGTHVAGIVSDLMGKFSYRILPVRVLDHEGRGYASNVAAGIRYAADRGAHVINLSLSGGHTGYVDDAVNYAIGKGCSVVVAAGNQSTDASNRCPAHIPGAITVSAIDQDYQLASFSNFGYGIDVGAPGVGIISADFRGGYVEKRGTSMAAPHIAALVALIRASGAANNTYDAEQLLFASCLDIGPAGKDPYYGWGVPHCTPIEAKLNVASVQADHWILRANSANPRDVAKVVFRDDGTVEFTNMEGGWTSVGTYYYTADQLTIECAEYLNGKEFFIDMGIGYISDGSFLQEDGSYATYTLTHASGQNASFGN